MPAACSAAPRPRRPAVRAWLVAFAVICGCDAAGPPAPALADDGALRAKVSACLGIDTPDAFTFFWPQYLGGAAGARACVAAARDCADVVACAGYLRAGCTAEDDRCDAGKAIACVALTSGLTVEAAITCDGDQLGNTLCSIEDDAKYGRGAFCHGGGCAREHCEADGVLVRCRGGLEVRTDCGAEGKTCAEADGQAYCAYDEPCTADRCAGDTIEICGGGRVTVRERCGELVPGSTCTNRNGLVECLAETPSPGCADETDFQSWCDAGVAVTCLAGVRAEADCGALPDGRCESTVSDDLSMARCRASF